MKYTISMVTWSIQRVLNIFFRDAGFTHIISTHFLLNKAITNTIRNQELDAKFTTIVTDPFSPHPMRFETKGNPYIVFSEEARQIGLREEIPENDLHIFSTIIDKKFSEVLSPEAISAHKKKHDIADHEQCVLIVGGGEGIINGERLLQYILDYPNFPKDTKYVFVCGKNVKLQKKLCAMAKRAKRTSDFVFLGFTEEMYEWMNASVLVVSKAGPATVFEAVALGKPIILYSYNGPQEVGNIRFVKQNQLGVFQKNYHKIPDLLYTSLSDPALLHTRTTNIHNISYENKIQDIIDFILA